MTLQQSAELKALRKDEATKLKAVTRLEKQLRAKLEALVRKESASYRKIERQARAEKKAISRAINAEIKPLRTQLNRLNEGRVPEASALAAIRKRIAILEQRLTS